MSYWDHRRPVRRARAVDADGLAHASAEILDEGGPRALTVRAVAGRLDVAAASLYSRIESVDDLFDLALDAALGDDPAVEQAVTNADLDELMLAYYRHLVRHPWACRVIAMRPPRGPRYVAFSERLVVLLVDAGAPEPLTAAYALSNFVIGCASTARVAGHEQESPVDPGAAPTYARLHAAMSGANAERTVVVGIAALRDAFVDVS